MLTNHAPNREEVIRQQQDGVLVNLLALLVVFGWWLVIDTAVLPPHVGMQEVWEIRNLFGIRLRPNWFRRICCGGGSELFSEHDGAGDLSLVGASFAVLWVVAVEPLAGARSRKATCFFFCVFICVLGVIF